MADNITPVPEWTPIPGWDDRTRNSGVEMNKQGQALANRVELVRRAPLQYATFAEAQAAAATLPDGQRVEIGADEMRDGRRTRYVVQSGALVFQGLVGDAESTSFISDGAGAVATDAQAKLREFVSVFDFMSPAQRADVRARTASIDVTAAVQASVNAVAADGGGVVWAPPGRYSIAGDLVPGSNVTLLGAGRFATEFIVPTGNSAKNTIFVNTNSATPFSNFTLDGLGFTGQWQAFQSEVAANGLITLKYVTNLTIRNCAFRYSRAFVLNINECNTVVIDGNLLEYSPRDMIAVWGTPDVRITNNILRHNDDDGISVNLETAQAEPIRSQIVITGNMMEDTGPIRTQAPKNFIISKNNIRRPKGAGVLLGVNNTSTNDTSSGHAGSVEGNVITDVIDRQWFVNGDQVGSANNRVYISIYSIPTRAGALAVAPGEVNPATGTVQSPYDFYYKKASIAAGSGSLRAPNGVQVKNNICKRTLPAVAAYSAWGYGQAYTKNGFVDYAVADVLVRAIGTRILLPFTNLVVEGNMFEVGREAIRFDLQAGVALAHRLAKGVVIRGNNFLDVDTAGINWIPSTLSHQDIRIEDNDFDCDPFFLSTNRGANGSWGSTSGGPTAIRVNQLGSAVITGNRVRNCASVIEQSGASGLQYVEGNLIFADAAVGGFSTSNKGVGTIPGIGSGDQWWLQYTDSDPTSATYSQSLGANLKNFSAMPTSGKWLAGTVVMARTTGVSGSAGSQYVLLGWLRRVTGSAHILNTDWSEMRCLTGT